MKKGRLLLKILAGVIALLLISGILFVTNSFVGNPISAAIANKEIKKYVEQNYSFLDVEVGKATYNFKDGNYMAKVESRTSIDTHFQVYYGRGQIRWDSYSSEVLGKNNTLTRLSNEYAALVKSILSEELGYESRPLVLYMDGKATADVKDLLELDMKFDRTLPLESEVTIRLDSDKHSLEEAAKVLQEAHRVLIDNNCKFDKYGLYIEGGETYIMINEVKPEEIESAEFLKLLEEARHNENPNGISVFIKTASN